MKPLSQPCQDCAQVYVGKTLKKCISEQKQAVKRFDEKNGITVHVFKHATIPMQAPTHLWIKIFPLPVLCFQPKEASLAVEKAYRARKTDRSVPLLPSVRSIRRLQYAKYML